MVVRGLVESAERRENPDNLELLDLLEDGEDLEMTDRKETPYDTHDEMHTHKDTDTQINYSFL